MEVVEMVEQIRRLFQLPTVKIIRCHRRRCCQLLLVFILHMKYYCSKKNNNNNKKSAINKNNDNQFNIQNKSINFKNSFVLYCCCFSLFSVLLNASAYWTHSSTDFSKPDYFTVLSVTTKSIKYISFFLPHLNTSTTTTTTTTKKNSKLFWHHISSHLYSRCYIVRITAVREHRFFLNTVCSLLLIQVIQLLQVDCVS